MIPASIDVTLCMSVTQTRRLLPGVWHDVLALLTHCLYVADSKIELCVGARRRVRYGPLSQKEALFEGVPLNVTLETAVQITARKP